MSKAAFIDYDGCLVAFSAPGKKRRPAKVSEAAVSALNDLTRATGAKLVVTSSWRLRQSVEQLAAIMARWGVLAEVVGKTPNIPEFVEHLDGDVKNFHFSNCRIRKATRGEEIEAWVRGFPELEGFVVVDDEDLKTPSLAERLIRPDPLVGLTMRDVEKAIDILRGTTCSK